MADKQPPAQSGAPGSTAASTGVLDHILDLVRNQSHGGLGGLVKSFEEKVLGSVISSWIGTGANQQITADQVTRVVGQDRINAIAAKLGVPPETVSNQVAVMLPRIVDRLTPKGTVPQGKELEESVAAVRQETRT